MTTKGVEDGMSDEQAVYVQQGEPRYAHFRRPAVPVEERTLRKTCYCNEIWCPTCYPPVPIAKPIPEERTAEMGLLNEIVNGGYLDRFPEQKRRVLDHIEGTAK